jgi:hypothetical protein
MYKMKERKNNMIIKGMKQQKILGYREQGKRNR